MEPVSHKSLVERDAAIIWHPYTQHKEMAVPIAVSRAKGSLIYDEDGMRYIDANSSWWTNLHGHAHPYIAKKIYEQAMEVEHVIFAGATHEPAVRLAERLVPILPGSMSRVFYSDNGSTAVEAAIKMAIQYQQHKGQKKKTKILALSNGYHGDTFGAMSVSERGSFTIAFKNYLFEVLFIEPGSQLNITSHFTDDIVCFIYEPLVQGAGGMKMYEADWLNELLCALKQENIICIADEVMTGFGRTGQLFASENLHHKPDIICLSKGLTGGTLPLAITACTEKIFEAFLDVDRKKTFFHGHSYTANPIGCAAALASLDLLETEECIAGISRIETFNREFCNKLNSLQNVNNPRYRGTILAFELGSPANEYLSNMRDQIIKLALNEGVLLRPLGNTVYIMPPFCITGDELQTLQKTLLKIIESYPVLVA